MNFKRDWRQGVAVLGVIALVVSQWPWRQRLTAVERELEQMRQQLTAVERSMPAAQPIQVAGLGSVAAGLPSSQGAHAGVVHLNSGMAMAMNAPTTFAMSTTLSAGPTVDVEMLPADAPVSQSTIRLARASLPSPSVLSDEELDQILAGSPLPAPAAAAATAGASAASAVRVSGVSATPEQAVHRTVRRVERGGVLLPKGKFQVEPTFTYTHVSSNRVNLSGFSLFDVIFIGSIDANEVDRDILTSSLNVRYGITNRLQGEIELPSQFQREETLSGPVDDRSEQTTTDFGASDIRTGLFYQLTSEHGMIPAMIGNLKVKVPTGQAPTFGSGSWGVRAGLTMLKSSDPVVLFSNLGYALNLPGDVNGISSNPGDSIEFSAGLAYALNYNLSVNGGFEQVFITPTQVDGASVVGSRRVISSLKAGLSYLLNKNLSMDFSFGTGLTEDSPDLTVSVSFPYTF